MPEIAEIIEKKFEEFKVSLLAELKVELENIISVGKEEILDLLAEKKHELTELSKQLEVTNSIAAIQQHVKKLQEDNRKLHESNKKINW